MWVRESEESNKREVESVLTACVNTHQHICVSTSEQQWQISWNHLSLSLSAASLPHSSSSWSVGCHHHGDALPLKQSTGEINILSECKEWGALCVQTFLKRRRRAHFARHRHLQQWESTVWNKDNKSIHEWIKKKKKHADNRWAMGLKLTQDFIASTSY